jgi:hypothetical protein
MAPAQEKDDSVFDFLYVDVQRIAVLLAQFDEYGHLTGLTKTVSTGSNTGGTWNVSVAKRDFSDSEQSSLQKQYDQRWIAPLTFLDKTQSMMKRDLAPGEMLRVDTGCLVAMQPTIDYDIQYVGKVKSALFGGEGLFFATLRGPGRIWIQSLPLSRLADRIVAASPRAGGSRREEGSILGGLGGLLDGDNR